MMKKAFWLVLIAILSIIAFDDPRCLTVYSDSPSGLLSSTDEIPKSFVRRQGNRLVVGEDNRPVFLRGICFANYIWDEDDKRSFRNSEVDFERVREMHMNTIRFYLNYKFFEDNAAPYRYKQSGWDWLDRNVQWAKARGMYLILAMMVPQGGYQSNGGGGALWRRPENQRRLAALWRAIAERYRDEPAIAGYDLLNEPVPTHSVDQWETLADQLATAVRSVDRHHLLIVERVNVLPRLNWSKLMFQPNFVLVKDADTAYAFSFYHPLRYTHQNAPWLGFPPGGNYPDSQRTEKIPGVAESFHRDKAYLERTLKLFTDFGAKNGVPMVCTEFGVYKDCFAGQKGGLLWANDMIDLMKAGGVHFTYHCYRETSFGIYRNDEGPQDSDQVNTDLIRLLTEKLP